MWTKYFKDIQPNDYSDPLLKRQVRTVHILGDAALEKEKLAEVTFFYCVGIDYTKRAVCKHHV